MTESRGRVPLLAAGSRVLACGLVVVVTLLPPAAAGEPGVTALLEALNLSSYPPGTKAPDFVSRTADDEPVSLVGLRGRVILLTFWATWCPPCREEMPDFEQLHRDFTPEGLTVLGINIREGKPTIQAYARELGLSFPLALDPKGVIDKAYGVVGLPTTFIIARDGRPVALAIGPRDWGRAQVRALIRALLEEPVVQRRPR